MDGLGALISVVVQGADQAFELVKARTDSGEESEACLEPEMADFRLEKAEIGPNRGRNSTFSKCFEAFRAK